MHPIKKYCLEKGLTQKDLAGLSGLYPQEISDFIAGRKKPGPLAAERIAKATEGAIGFKELRPDLVNLVLGEQRHE
jgi:DNA-binding transcriptional regulator YdaS (Cro superfamily)